MALTREIGLLELTLAGIGVILGAGIYVLVGKAAGIAQEYVWASFAAAGFIAIMTGLSYSELSSRFPKAGAEYVYAKNAFSSFWAFLIGLALVIVGVASTATVALGFGSYLSALTTLPAFWGMILILGLSTLIIWFGAKLSASVAGFLSLIEIAGLLIVIYVGFPHLGEGFALPPIEFVPTVLSAAALIFFAFLGFEDLVRLAEETKNTTKIMPIALLLAIGISTILYILVAAAAVGVLGGAALGASAAPLADVVATVWGSDSFLLVGLIALFATGNTVLLLLLAASRIMYGMAKEKTLPRLLGLTQGHQPRNALIVAAVLAVLLASYKDITFVAHVTDGLLFIVFALMNLALILIRMKPRDTYTGFRVPLSIGKIPIPSVIGFITSGFMLIYVDQDALIFGIAVLVAGAAAYYIFHRPSSMKRGNR
ncbi:MAG: APC family permease [Candidatus Diapherotrites archaeon]|nr:APC family permease [Candidatus Diapherotrites archaeon]MDZ4256923.1 APC family permease [archaeon]